MALVEPQMQKIPKKGHRLSSKQKKLVVEKIMHLRNKRRLRSQMINQRLKKLLLAIQIWKEGNRHSSLRSAQQLIIFPQQKELKNNR